MKSGKINGNPLEGLCSRVVIETKRVFDGCHTLRNDVTFTLMLPNAVASPTEVLSVVATGARLTNYTVVQEGDKFRVSGDFITDYTVTYVNGGVVESQVATTCERKSVLLRLPNSAIVPYSIDAVAVLQTLSATFINNNTVSVIGCVFQLIKVTATVDILIPTYGYAKYPPCEGYPVCNGRYEDLYPFLPE